MSFERTSPANDEQRTRVFRPLGFALFLLLGGCPDSPGAGGETSDDHDRATEEQIAVDATELDAGTTPMARAEIGPTGGELSTDDESATLYIREGLLESATMFTIREIEPPPGSLGRAYEFGPDGSTFPQPVVIALNYEGLDLGGVPAEALRIGVWIEDRWALVPHAGVDPELKLVAALTPHFSSYSIVVPNEHDGPPACHFDEEAFRGCCSASTVAPPPSHTLKWHTAPTVFQYGNLWSCFPIGSTWPLANCYEQRTGYELGHCTRCQRDCCRAASGVQADRNGACGCSRSGFGLGAEAFVSDVQECWQRCEDRGVHLTQCALERMSDGEGDGQNGGAGEGGGVAGAGAGGADGSGDGDGQDGGAGEGGGVAGAGAGGADGSGDGDGAGAGAGGGQGGGAGEGGGAAGSEGGGA